MRAKRRFCMSFNAFKPRPASSDHAPLNVRSREWLSIRSLRWALLAALALAVVAAIRLLPVLADAVGKTDVLRMRGGDTNELRGIKGSSGSVVLAGDRIAGSYSGSTDGAVSSCPDPDDNGPFGPITTSVIVNEPNGSAISGTINLSAPFNGSLALQGQVSAAGGSQRTLSGTVTTISGPGSGQGNFTGTWSAGQSGQQDTLVLNVSGAGNLVGDPDVCAVAATVSVAKPAPCPAKGGGLTDFALPPSSSQGASMKKYKFSVVDTCTGKPIPDSSVSIKFSPVPFSGGHAHDDQNRPASDPNNTTGSAGSSDGNFEALYVAPEVSGKTTITVECLVPDGRQCSKGSANIDVRVDGLIDLSGTGGRFFLVGQKNAHPSNHYGTPGLLTGLVGPGMAYGVKFNDNLNYNDMSLPWGGVFDICATAEGNCQQGITPWVSPHKGHNFGLNVDVRLVPPARRSALLQMAWDNQLGVLKEEDGPTPHWHLTYGNP